MRGLVGVVALVAVIVVVANIAMQPQALQKGAVVIGAGVAWGGQ